jgi:hypothetical protein
MTHIRQFQKLMRVLLSGLARLRPWAAVAASSLANESSRFSEVAEADRDAAKSMYIELAPPKLRTIAAVHLAINLFEQIQTRTTGSAVRLLGFVLSHTGRKNKNATRVGHPLFVLI